MIDKAIALDLYRQGVTLSVIGKQFGVSRQRIHQFIMPYQPTREIFTNGAQTRKASKIKHPNASEIWVAGELGKRGFRVEFTPYNYPYDLLLNGTIRIEVKHRMVTKNNGYTGTIRVYKNNFDYLIIAIGNLEKMQSVYIIPSIGMVNVYNLALNPLSNGKHARMHFNKWDLIT